MNTEIRRKAPRRSFDGQVGVLFKGHMTISHCSQLGEGGALIKSDALLEGLMVADNVVITLFLPNIGGMVASAKCVYRNEEDQLGFQFTELDMKFKVRIREFVSRRKAVEVN